MKRDELKALDLTEEQVDKIMQLHGETLNTVKSEKSHLETQNEDLKKQISERDKQLSDLKKETGDHAELQKKIDELTDTNKKTKDEFEAKLKEQALDHAIDKALLAKKAKNLKAAKALLDRDALQIGKDGAVVGLDEQLTGIVKENGYLFGPEKPDRGNEPPEGKESSKDGLVEQFADQFNKQSGGELDW